MKSREQIIEYLNEREETLKDLYKGLNDVQVDNSTLYINNLVHLISVVKVQVATIKTILNEN